MTEQTVPADLSETQALNLLHTLAATDPDYPTVAQEQARAIGGTLSEAGKGAAKKVA
nr:hypothetical protein [Gammaproteobacteria bacterium]